MDERMKRVRELIEKSEIEALLITKPENIRYISGFTAGNDAKLLVSGSKKYLFTDSRYFGQVAKESQGWELVPERASGNEGLIDIGTHFKRIGVESHSITYQFYVELDKMLKAEVIPLENTIEDLRMIKDERELALMRETARISDEVFLEICHLIKPGLPEKQIADHIVALLKEKGCAKESFDTIVVSGENAALPHGKPGEKAFDSGDMITMDFGGFYHGYAGDMTRTVAVKKASQRLKDHYQAVLEAQALGVALVRAGQICADIDRQVRYSLQKYDLDKYFIHSTGHGVGLEVHEKPTVSARSQIELQKNMVITIEPGIYIPGWGGIRIEDTVIVAENGCEIITKSEKSLLII